MQSKDIRYTGGQIGWPHSPSYGKMRPSRVIVIKQEAVAKQQEPTVTHGRS